VLEQARRNLNITLDLRGNDPAYIRRNWSYVHADISSWWTAYKAWEAVDTFDEAFEDKRMTVRTFNTGYATQVQKTFKRGTIQVTQEKFFSDGRYTKTDEKKQLEYQKAFNNLKEIQKYHAQRGIDSSAFANPANFASRETKYDAGLHDLSASILNPKLSIFDQVHNNEEGAHYSFLPLSMEEDQEVIYNLTRIAKDRVSIPGLYQMVRNYRAEMTRVKLAYEMDMGIGYTAVSSPGQATGPQFKLRYGLAATTTLVGEALPQPTTENIYDERRKAARKFKSIIGVRDAKNEIVIAMRKHAGPFPVFAVRRGDQLVCYNITTAKLMERNGKQITKNGHLIELKDWTPASPSVDTIAMLEYGDTFPQDFAEVMKALDEIPKKDGLHVVVAGPKNDSEFTRISSGVKLQVTEFNNRGCKLHFAQEVNEKYNGEQVAVHFRHV
jgi:hypothetical protein